MIDVSAKKAIKTKNQWVVLKGIPAKAVHAMFDDEKKALAEAERLVEKGEAEFASIEHRIVPATSKASATDADDAASEGEGTKEGE